MDYELTIAKASKLLGVSESRISQLISDGTLDSITIRGHRRISEESVEQYKKSCPRPGRPPARRNAVPFTLMSGGYEVMSVTYDPGDDNPLACVEVLDPARAPWATVTANGRCKRRELNDWWRSRSIPGARPGIGRKTALLGLSDTWEIPIRNNGLSLSDCFWLKPHDAGSDMSWGAINYFDNPFDEDRDDGWDYWLSNVGLDSPDNASEGVLPKKWLIRNGRRMLLKGCHSDDQRPYNEVAASALHSRIMNADEFVHYTVEQTKDGPACVCENFLSPNEEFIAASWVKATLPSIKGSSMYDRFCRYVGNLGMDEAAYRNSICKMMVGDYILANIDRHWRNFGFIRNIDSLEMRPAPAFDTGNCLWYWKGVREIERLNFDFALKPFGPEPERELSAIDCARWYSPEMLEGFVEEAVGILSASDHARSNGRLDFIAEAIGTHIARINAILPVLAFR